MFSHPHTEFERAGRPCRRCRNILGTRPSCHSLRAYDGDPKKESMVFHISGMSTLFQSNLPRDRRPGSGKWFSREQTEAPNPFSDRLSPAVRTRLFSPSRGETFAFGSPEGP